MDAVPAETRKDPAVSRGSSMSLQTYLALMLAAASFVFVAAYTYGHASFKGESEGLLCPVESKGGSKESDDQPLASSKGEDESNEESEERPGGAGATPGSTTGQRVAGHLLAVLLLASVTAAIVEAVRARMTRPPAAIKPPDPATPGVSEVHHHGSNAGGRTSRRGTLQEKSYSYDGYIYRSRSSSAGVSNQQESVSALSTTSASRAQKAMRVRMGGKTGATPPLLRRSSFPVLSRTLSRGDSNGGSPAAGSRKPSITDIGDDDLGELQKKRVRLIRRF